MRRFIDRCTAVEPEPERPRLERRHLGHRGQEIAARPVRRTRPARHLVGSLVDAPGEAGCDNGGGITDLVTNGDAQDVDRHGLWADGIVDRGPPPGRQAKAPTEVVARPHRNDADDGRRVHQRRQGVVHEAVTAGQDQSFHATVLSLGDHGRHLVGGAGLQQINGPASVSQLGDQRARSAQPAVTAGCRIDQYGKTQGHGDEGTRPAKRSRTDPKTTI